MAGGSEVGSAHISIFPVMKGFRARVNKEMQAAGKGGSSRFAAAFGGQKIGGRIGRDLNNGFTRAAGAMASPALKRLQQDVAAASKAYGAAMLKSQDAAGAVRVAEAKLADAIKKHGAESVQAIAAEERLASARRRQQTANDTLKASVDRLKTAQDTLRSTQTALESGSLTLGRRILATASSFKAGLGGIERGKSSFTGMAGAIGSLVRAIAGVDAFGPAFSRLAAAAAKPAARIGAMASQLGTRITGSVKNTAATAQTTIKGWAASASTTIGGMAGRITKPFAPVATLIGRALSPVAGYVGNVASAAGGVLGKLPAVASAAAGGIAGAFRSAANASATAFRGLAAGAAAAISAGAAAMGAAVLAHGKQALAAYATWEQAVGGVDTLFKKSSATVQKYAAEAYKTAGVSANDYMSQVTSFAASLVSSLGGDTAKAAEIGNMAVKDMSDNANKMGTDMELIQQTYQSLARGNYAMLDNLKLGYGGTKSELERLLSDAQKLTGQKYDVSNFADVVQAIHAVQKQLGITGTTAREAATTIEGSVNAMKAAWGNWLSGLGQDNADMDALSRQLADSIGTALGNILPRIQVIAKSVVQALPGMFSALVSTLPQPFQQVVGKVGDVFKTLVDGIGPLLAPLGAAFAALGAGGLGGLLSKLPLVGGALSGLAGPLSILGGPIGVLTAAIGGLIATSPELQQVFGTTVKGVLDSLQQAVTALMPGIQGIGTMISTAITQIMPLVTQLLAAIIPVIGQVIQQLTPLIPMILTPLLAVIQQLIPPITQVVAAILPVLIQAVQALAPVVTMVIATIMQVIQALMPVVTTVINTIVSFITAVLLPTVRAMLPTVTAVINTVANVVRGIVGIIRGVVNVIAGIFSGDWNRVWSGLGQIVRSAVNTVKSIFSGAVDIGRNFIQGLWNGISSAGEWIWGKISGFCSGIVDKIKGFFGIHSPSALFRDQIGRMLGMGLAIGVDDSTPKVTAAVRGLATAAPTGLDALQAPAATAGTMPAGAQPATAGPGGAGRTITVNNTIDARGLDPDALFAIMSTRTRAAAARW